MSVTHGHFVPGKKLGKRAQRIDKRTLKFEDYLKPGVIAPIPPAEVSWVMKVPDWQMLLNDSLGDCVPAAMLHMVQQWSHYAGTELVPSNADALRLYEQIGGFVPGDPSTDNGANMLDALNFWRQNGIKVGNTVHKISAFVQVDPTNAKHVQLAIMLFGNVFTGVALPVSAQTQTGWTVPDGGAFNDGSPGSWGGHCIPIMAGSPETLSCITWGERLKMSHNFFFDYVDELYAIVTPDWIEKNGFSPGGFDLPALVADLAAL
jgi:hypothetical protein